jgi:hypothetical protein
MLIAVALLGLSIVGDALKVPSYGMYALSRDLECRSSPHSMGSVLVCLFLRSSR